MRSRGIALDPKARRQYPAIRGNVMVNSSVCNELGRAANVARVDVGMPLDPDPLPPLLEATLAGMPLLGLSYLPPNTSPAVRMRSLGVVVTGN
jgi:hypothetical protein